MNDMRQLIALCEAEALAWTYELETRRLDHILVHCRSNAGDQVDGFIFFQSGWNLVWDVDRRAAKPIQERYGSTGLMRPMIAAIQKALGIYLAKKRPPFVIITGSESKRQNLYASWVAWQFPGYTSEAIDRGVGFVREGVVAPWKRR